MKKCLLVFVFGTLVYQNSFSQNAWNLRQAIDYAIANNISVKQANIASRQAELDFSLNRLGAYPTASISNNWSMQFGRRENPTTGIFQNSTAITSSFGFSSNFLIFNFFSQRNT